MEIDPNDLIESARSVTDQRAARSARLNAAVAITVAVLATFMGICKVKDDNRRATSAKISRRRPRHSWNSPDSAPPR